MAKEQKEIQKIEGKISTVKPTKTREGKDTFQIKIGEMIFGGFGICPPLKEGEEIIIEYQINGKYNNIVNLKDKEGKIISPSKNTKDTSKDTIKMWAISEGIKFYVNTRNPDKIEWSDAKKEILKMAKELEEEVKK